MKLLSIAIPCYNAEQYLGDCLSSLLNYDGVELIVINDGSKDRTLEIAKRFQEKYPDYIKIIDKENGGHGSGLNAAYKIAEGLYFKCCDSDDTLDREALLILLNKIKELEKIGKLPDVFLTDYVAVYKNRDREQACGLKKFFPVDELVTYEKVKRLGISDYAMIHMTYVKTSLLKENNLNLVEKTFYEDNQFVYFVFGHANSFYYLDKPIYRYSLGETGQSVSLESMRKNYMHEMRAFNATFREFKWSDYESWSKKKRRFVLHDLSMMYMLAYAYAFLSYSKEKRQAFRQLLKSCKEYDRKLFRKVRWTTAPFFATLIPVFIRPPITIFGTNIISKIKGWNY